MTSMNKKYGKITKREKPKTSTELLMEDMDREPRMFREVLAKRITEREANEKKEYDYIETDISKLNIGERSKPLGHEDEFSIDDYGKK